MNKGFFIGNLTRDPELRQTQNGTPVCSFTLAVNKRSQSEHPEADYIRVTVWRKLGESCAKWLKKGNKCMVEGTVSAAAWVDNKGQARAGLEVVADDVEFLTPRKQNVPDGYVPVDEDLPDFN